MRRSGKEPSRVNLASYFSSALDPDHSLHGGPQVIPEVRACHDRLYAGQQADSWTPVNCTSAAEGSAAHRTSWSVDPTHRYNNIWLPVHLVMIHLVKGCASVPADLHRQGEQGARQGARDQAHLLRARPGQPGQAHPRGLRRRAGALAAQAAAARHGLHRQGWRPALLSGLQHAHIGVSCDSSDAL